MPLCLVLQVRGTCTEPAKVRGTRCGFDKFEYECVCIECMQTCLQYPRLAGLNL